MEKSGIEKFKEHNRKKLLVLIALALSIAVLFLVVLYINADLNSFSSLFNILFNKDNSSDSILVWDLEIPRIISAILAGFALGISGTVMQCVLKNPLGSPYTLGVSNAAAFGASVGIVLLGGGIITGQSVATITINDPYIVAISAFIWSMVATGVIILLVKVTKVSPETMVLAGVALSSIFSAGISFLQYMYNEYALSTIVFWQFGSMGKATWEELGLIFIITLVIIVYFLYNRLDYNALDVGDDVASSLGVNVNRLRLVSLFAAALLTAVIVSFMGIVAFIGLLGPHIVRRLIGNDHRYLLPGSMFMGALILLVSDCIGQNLMDFTLPVGIITSFLGGPLFLYLLIRGYRKKKIDIRKLISSKGGSK